MAWYWIVLIGYAVCGIISLIVNRRDVYEPFDVWLIGVLGPAIVIGGLITEFLFKVIPKLWRRGR